MKQIHISIIGAGAMGGSIARAVGGSNMPWTLTVIDSSAEKLRSLKKAHKMISVSSAYDSLKAADVVVLAVKPQSFDELAALIKPVISKKALVLSVMTGRTIKNISKMLATPRVIHAMPNLGAQFGESMTVWTAGGLTSADKKFAGEFFSLIGEHLYVSNEDMVNKNTSISASGVGFLVYMVEAYITETIKLGFSEKEAEQIVLQTFKAANTLLQKKDRTPAEIRAAVTSKAGTTEAGLTVLMGKQFSKILSQTLQKAYKRAKQLSK
jgi:pyrroline-5-carboxylate reductase